jgi:Gluconate 2-dehydrogenase subunit 3
VNVEAVLGRREWICRALQTLPALAILPAGSGAEVDSDLNWKSAVLSSEQNAALVVLGERILPGSSAAHCNRVIDLILTVESEKNKRDLFHALSAIDDASKLRHRQPFTGLKIESQDELLAQISKPGHPLYQQFDVVKEWIADTYWSSQQGLKELGWNGRMAWSNFAACKMSEPG